MRFISIAVAGDSPRSQSVSIEQLVALRDAATLGLRTLPLRQRQKAIKALQSIGLVFNRLEQLSNGQWRTPRVTDPSYELAPSWRLGLAEALHSRGVIDDAGLAHARETIR